MKEKWKTLIEAIKFLNDGGLNIKA